MAKRNARAFFGLRNVNVCPEIPRSQTLGFMVPEHAVSRPAELQLEASIGTPLRTNSHGSAPAIQAVNFDLSLPHLTLSCFHLAPRQ